MAYSGDYQGERGGKYKPEKEWYYEEYKPEGTYDTYGEWRAARDAEFSKKYGSRARQTPGSFATTRKDYVSRRRYENYLDEQYRDEAMQQYEKDLEYWESPGQRWLREGKPTAEQIGSATERQLQTQYNRQAAKLRGQLGYAKAMGGGESGRWESLETGLAAKQAKRTAEASRVEEEIMAQMEQDFMTAEDKKAFAKELENKRQAYRKEELARQAELNESSWWETAGKIIGGAALIVSGIFTGGATWAAVPAYMAGAGAMTSGIGQAAE